MQGARIKAVGANVSWLAAERIIRMGIGLFMLGLIARYLGTEQFGAIRYALDMSAVFAAVATAGMEGIVIRELVRSPESVGRILASALAIRLGGGICAVTLIALVGILTGLELRDWMLCVIVGSAFFPQAGDVVDLWFQRRVLSRYTVVARLIALGIGTALKLILVGCGADLLWFGAAVFFDAVVASLGLWMVFRRHGGGA